MSEVIRHLRSFAAPVIMTSLLPAAIIAWERAGETGPLFPPPPGLRLLGLLVTLGGFILAVLTIRMFIRIGQGTIMPWDPTRKLITGSLYAYMRNPMILSVLIVQIGFALLFASRGVAWMAAIFFVVNTVYFIFSEEPGLEKRFGQEYVEYKKNVPRWIPRLKPWRPE